MVRAVNLRWLISKFSARLRNPSFKTMKLQLIIRQINMNSSLSEQNKIVDLINNTQARRVLVMDLSNTFGISEGLSVLTCVC